MKALLPKTDIYALTDSRQCLGRSNVEVVRELLKAEIRIIQYREKDLSGGKMLEECLEIRALTREAGCCFLVNDHVDLAMLCDADGVHVGQDDLPLAAVRQLLGKEKIIGVSTHAVAEAKTAIAQGADYIGVGPLYPTKTKVTTPPVGLSYLAEIAGFCPIPFVAIGGVNELTLPRVLAGGATMVAIVSAITLAGDIPGKVAELRRFFSTNISSSFQGREL